MNKASLVEAMSRQLGSTKAEAQRALDAFTQSVLAGLREKEHEVAIVGFGTFRLSRRKARVGRNPRTGAKLQIPASLSVSFRPGKALKSSL